LRPIAQYLDSPAGYINSIGANGAPKENFATGAYLKGIEL
jgi:hypothetical protein